MFLSPMFVRRLLISYKDRIFHRLNVVNATNGYMHLALHESFCVPQKDTERKNLPLNIKKRNVNNVNSSCGHEKGYSMKKERRYG